MEHAMRQNSRTPQKKQQLLKQSQICAPGPAKIFFFVLQPWKLNAFKEELNKKFNSFIGKEKFEVCSQDHQNDFSPNAF